MAEATLNDLIKVLKQNDLNDGQDADRQFAKTEAVHSELKELNKMLSTYFMKEKAGAGDDLEEKREKREKKAEVQKEEKKRGPATFKEGFMQGTGLEFLKNLAGLPAALLTGVLGTKLAATLLPQFGKILGRTLLRGPFIGALALFGEDVLTQGIESITGIELSGEQATQLNDTLKESIGLSIFSKRLGLARLVGGVIGMGLDKLFDLDDKAKGELFGIELPISQLDLATYGATIAAFFGPSLITGALTKAFTGKVPPGATVGRNAKGQFTKLKPGLATSFRSGFVTRGGLGWGAVVAGLGITAGAVIGDAIGSEETGNAVGDALVAAGLVGAFFGPQGAIIAALTVMAFKGLGALGNWLKGRSDKVTKEVEDNLAALDTKDITKLSEEEIKAKQKTVAQAIREAERLQQLAGRQNNERGEKLMAAAEEKMLALGVQNNVRSQELFASEFMGGNRAAGEQLLRYFDDRLGGNLTPDDFQDLGMTLVGDGGIKEMQALTKALQDLYGEMYKVNFPDPNFTIPKYKEGFSSSTLLGRGIFKDMFAPDNSAFYSLLPPTGGNGNGEGLVINAPSVTGGNSATALLSGTGAVVDRVSPHNQMWSSLR